MYQETEDVCVLFYGLAGGFASPMARLRVHPHHQGLSLALEEKNLTTGTSPQSLQN